MEPEESGETPLWNPNNQTRSFELWYSMVPSLEKGVKEIRPFGPSFVCLTCHDGVLGSNVHQLGVKGLKPINDPLGLNKLQKGLQSPDHPDSIYYPRQPDGRMVEDRPGTKLKRYWSIPDRDEAGVILPTGPKSYALDLQQIDADDPIETSKLVRTYKGVIHCDSCHNPHDNAIRPFLRVSNKTLCLVCHDR